MTRFFINRQIELPTYHLANIVDDHLMEVSHVIRKWWGMVAFRTVACIALPCLWVGGYHACLCAFALVAEARGNGKLRRDGDRLGFRFSRWSGMTPSREMFFRLPESGYLPEAVINFLALLGWNPGKWPGTDVYGWIGEIVWFGAIAASRVPNSTIRKVSGSTMSTSWWNRMRRYFVFSDRCWSPTA